MGLKSCGQWLSVLVETHDRWCPSGVYTGTSAKGLNALSASLPMASNCCREGVPSRGTWTGLRSGLVQTTWCSTRTNARGQCAWVRTIPRKYREWIESSLEDGSDVAWWDAQYELAECTFSPESQLYLGLHHKIRGQQVKDLILLLEGCVNIWGPHHEDIRLLEQVQRRTGRMIRRLEDCYEDRLREMKLFSLGKGRLWRDLRAHSNTSKEGQKKFRERECSQGHAMIGQEGMASNGKNGDLDLRNQYFPVKVMRSWNQRSYGSPKVFNPRLGEALSSLV